LDSVMETGSVSQFNVLRKCDGKKVKFGMCSRHANRVNGVGGQRVCASLSLNGVPVLRGLVKLAAPLFRVGREEDV
jgi:hypothetical protein